jgi:hypothetical protein
VALEDEPVDVKQRRRLVSDKRHKQVEAIVHPSSPFVGASTMSAMTIEGCRADSKAPS